MASSSTPPPDRSGPARFHSSGGRAEIIVDQSIPKDIAEVLSELEIQRRQNIEKLRALDPGKASTFIELERDLVSYERQFFLEWKKAFLEYTQDETNVHLQEAFSELDRKFYQAGLDLATKYKLLGLTQDHIDLLVNKEHTYSDFICTKERVLNPLINDLLFFNQLQAFFNANQERIIQEFQQAGILAKGLTLETIDPPKYINEGDETHHMGKKPVIVTFNFIGGKIFKFVCKPRDALLDQNIIELFKQINRFSSSEKSGSHALPEYTIISPSSESGWKMSEDLGAISLWELIDGIHPDKRQNASSFIDQDVIKKQQGLLYQKLNRLDAILTKLNISDLIFTNIFFVGLDSDDPKIIPIDLENVCWGKQPTLLEGHPEQVTLTPKELEFIGILEKKLEDLVVRVLPLGTQELLTYAATHKTNEDLTSRSTENLGNQGYETFSRERLKRFLLKDTLNSDVPYLTELRKVLYYGLPHQGIEIGRRK